MFVRISFSSSSQLQNICDGNLWLWNVRICCLFCIFLLSGQTSRCCSWNHRDHQVRCSSSQCTSHLPHKHRIMCHLIFLKVGVWGDPRPQTGNGELRAYRLRHQEVSRRFTALTFVQTHILLLPNMVSKWKKGKSVIKSLQLCHNVWWWLCQTEYCVFAMFTALRACRDSVISTTGPLTASTNWWVCLCEAFFLPFHLWKVGNNLRDQSPLQLSALSRTLI